MTYAILIPDKGFWTGSEFTEELKNALLFFSAEEASDYFVSGLNNIYMFAGESAAAFIPCFVKTP